MAVRILLHGLLSPFSAMNGQKPLPVRHMMRLPCLEEFQDLCLETEERSNLYHLLGSNANCSQRAVSSADHCEGKGCLLQCDIPLD